MGFPGAELGLKVEAPTVAAHLETEGHMTAQYGENRLDDRDEHLPTHYGFDV